MENLKVVIILRKYWGLVPDQGMAKQVNSIYEARQEVASFLADFGLPTMFYWGEPIKVGRFMTVTAFIERD